MKRNEITVGKYLRRFALYGALAAILTLGVTSCDDGKVEANKYDHVTTTLIETGVNKYEIESEKPNKKSESLVVIKKMDGSLDTMKYEEVKHLFANKDPMAGYEGEATPQTYYHSHAGDMWFILFWSNYGYHLGRPYDTPIYRGYYHTPTAYRTAQYTQNSVVNSRTTTRVSRTSTKAPISSTRGYGGGSFRSYGG